MGATHECDALHGWAIRVGVDAYTDQSIGTEVSESTDDLPNGPGDALGDHLECVLDGRTDLHVDTDSSVVRIERILDECLEPTRLLCSEREPDFEVL